MYLLQHQAWPGAPATIRTRRLRSVGLVTCSYLFSSLCPGNSLGKTNPHLGLTRIIKTVISLLSRGSIACLMTINRNRRPRVSPIQRLWGDGCVLGTLLSSDRPQIVQTSCLACRNVWSSRGDRAAGGLRGRARRGMQTGLNVQSKPAGGTQTRLL